MTSVIYAPPTPSPGASTGAPASTTAGTTTAPMTQLPTTGPSGPTGSAWGVLLIGLVLLLAGLVAVFVARHRRERTA